MKPISEPSNGTAKAAAGRGGGGATAKKRAPRATPPPKTRPPERAPAARKPAASSRGPAARSDAPLPALQPAPERADLLTLAWLRFSRFGWDVLGVALLAWSLLTFLGFLNRDLQMGWTQGFLISWWVSALAVGFGWGWPLVAAAIGLLGVMCLRRRWAPWPAFRLGRVLALEGMAFGVLVLLAIGGGLSLDNAEAGTDGGVIGWGLARLVDRALPLPWSTIAVLAATFWLAGWGLGVWQWGFRHLVMWLEAANPSGPQGAAVAVLGAAPAAALPAAPAPAATEPPTPPQRRLDLPPLDLLLDDQGYHPDNERIEETKVILHDALAEFGIPANVIGHRVGPTVTQFQVEPGFVEKPGPDGKMVQQKVRVAQISRLSRDLARSLSAERLRIEAPVPGQSYVGIEVPNQRVSIVRMRSLLDSAAFRRLSSPLSVVFGRDVSGEPVAADLARMPHLLIAGTTGSGKSVCIASIVTCLVMNNTPDELRMALLDPKMVELARFNGLPHIFGKVETQLDRMLGVLQWGLMEMDRRYRLLEEARSRDIFSYNSKQAKKNLPGLPRIVILIDELADLMMTAPDQTEHSLIRLAQMARATGMHLVVATQRPSTDVITGLIKANFPARLAFTVASSIDSRVILDTSGAETLLGKGDMLFLNPEQGTPVRAQGAWVSDGEVESVLDFWQERKAAGEVTTVEEAPWEGLVQAGKEDDNSDKLVQQAIQVVRQTQRASTSLLQRRLRIGYPRAARLMDELEALGVVGPSQSGGKERDVLLPRREEGEEDDLGE